MTHLIKPNGSLPEREATPEQIFTNRRNLLKTMGLGAIGVGALGTGALLGPWAAEGAETDPAQMLAKLKRLQSPRNPAFQVDYPITKEITAATFNNFYEFSTGKEDVWEEVKNFQPDPWKVEVSGLVGKPRTFDMEELLRFPLQERVYRFRCVEAWAMVVPWVGFPMKALLEKVQPLSKARYVKFTGFLRPEQASRQSPSKFWFSREPWPYTEGLSLAEAMNDLTLLTVGSYGHILPKQHGAPIRLITPWKYGFKSIKSITKIELTETRPATFWNTLAPQEYGFISNVNPAIPHPRWSQESERVLGTGERRKTLPYNGYGDFVAAIYPKG